MRTKSILSTFSFISLLFIFFGLISCVDKKDDSEAVRQFVARLESNQANQFNS